METKRLGRLLPLLSILLACLLMPSCSGVDPVRHRAERASHALAVRCADGWFQGLPNTPDDQRLVRQSLDDWGSRLDRDAQLLAPGGGR